MDSPCPPDSNKPSIPTPPCLFRTLGKIITWLLLILLTTTLVSIATFGTYSLYSAELVCPAHLPPETRITVLIANVFAALIMLTLAVRGLYPDPSES